MAIAKSYKFGKFIGKLQQCIELSLNSWTMAFWSREKHEFERNQQNCFLVLIVLFFIDVLSAGFFVLQQFGLYSDLKNGIIYLMPIILKVINIFNSSVNYEEITY